VLRVVGRSPPVAAFALAAFAAGALLPLRGPPFFGGGRLPAIVSGFVCAVGEPASPRALSYMLMRTLTALSQQRRHDF